PRSAMRCRCGASRCTSATRARWSAIPRARPTATSATPSGRRAVWAPAPCGSAWGSRTSRTCGPISTRPCTPPDPPPGRSPQRRDVGRDAEQRPAAGVGPGIAEDLRNVDVGVIGAAQVGLSADHDLQRHGDLSWEIIDAEAGPRGAWRHRWESLTMATINGIRELPGMPAVEAADHLPARLAVPDSFARFEQRFRVPIQRPVRVIRVEDDPAADGAERPRLVHSIAPDGSRRAPLRTRAVLNATGTWPRPFVPAHPGAAEFRGRQLHTVDYPRAEDFTGARVGIIGGGI